MLAQTIVLVPVVMVGLGIVIVLHTSGVVRPLGDCCWRAPWLVVVAIQMVPDLLEGTPGCGLAG